MGFLRINVFQNKSYEVIFSVHKILSHESNYYADVVK